MAKTIQMKCKICNTEYLTRIIKKYSIFSKSRADDGLSQKKIINNYIKAEKSKTKLTHFVFENVLKHRHFVWILFCWAYEQMLDVHCRCAPGCTFADTSPVVVVEYNVDVVANIHIHRCCCPYYFVSHMQVMADRLFSGENCKRQKKQQQQFVNKKSNTNYDLMNWRKWMKDIKKGTHYYATALCAICFTFLHSDIRYVVIIN